VRAVTERTYRLRTETTDIGSEEVARWSPEQHRQAFTALVAGLLADFDRYLGRDDVEPGHDEDIRQTAVHLTREEMRQLVDELTAVVARYRARSPEGRTRRLLTTVLLPAG
jgi:hypothetical protein